ncbi:MAG: aminopeptidase P family protein [Staphylothermus sp.]|nr:aminopeptidase P family protein [Staphylothermus sp.]
MRGEYILKHQLEKLESIMEKENINSIILTGPDNIEYFLGVRTIADSPLLLYYEKKGEPKLYVPLLEYYRFRDYLENTNVKVYAVSKTLKPSDAEVIDKSFREIISSLSKKERIGYDKEYTSPLTSYVLSALGEKIVDISKHISKYRMIKEDWEIENIKKAVDITEKGILEMVNNLSETITETELTGFFEFRVRRAGIDEYAFAPLVLFIPNNSYPHHLPTNNRLGKRNLVLVDVGVKYGGRCSDLTRMIIWGRKNKEELKAIEAVNEAIDNVIDKGQPGMKASELAEVAVKTLEKYELTEKFIHGLGHGIGILVHEPPYIRTGSETVLEPGMVFTIEPGVYFAGKYGVRIEEDVLVTKKGLKVLSEDLERVFIA